LNKVAAVAVGQMQRDEQNREKLMAEIKLLKQDLHTSKKEFILACKYMLCCFLKLQSFVDL